MPLAISALVLGENMWLPGTQRGDPTHAKHTKHNNNNIKDFINI
jgi:hypothetical protein